MRLPVQWERASYRSILKRIAIRKQASNVHGGGAIAMLRCYLPRLCASSVIVTTRNAIVENMCALRRKLHAEQCLSLLDLVLF